MHAHITSVSAAAGVVACLVTSLFAPVAFAQTTPSSDSPASPVDPGASPDGDLLSPLLSTPLVTPFQNANWRNWLADQGVSGLGMGLPLQLANANTDAYVSAGPHGAMMQGWSTTAVIGASTGWVLGVPLGVAQAGQALNHTGSYGWTVLGGLAGAAVGGGLTAAVLASNDSTSVGTLAALAFTTLVLDLGGSVLGYELSSSTTAAQPPAWTRITPSFSVAMGGETVGLSGTF